MVAVRTPWYTINNKWCKCLSVLSLPPSFSLCLPLGGSSFWCQFGPRTNSWELACLHAWSHRPGAQHIRKQIKWSLQGVGALGHLHSRVAMPLEEQQQEMHLVLQHSKAATLLGLLHSRGLVSEEGSKVEPLAEGRGRLAAALLQSPLLRTALAACGACADDWQAYLKICSVWWVCDSVLLFSETLCGNNHSLVACVIVTVQSLLASTCKLNFKADKFQMTTYTSMYRRIATIVLLFLCRECAKQSLPSGRSSHVKQHQTACVSGQASLPMGIFLWV